VRIRRLKILQLPNVDYRADGTRPHSSLGREKIADCGKLVGCLLMKASQYATYSAGVIRRASREALKQLPIAFRFFAIQ